MSQQERPQHPFDERSKSFYMHYFKNQQIRSGRQFEVFSRGRSIDILTECIEEDYARIKDSCFSHFQRVNSLEFKGPHDPLTTHDLNLIISRIWGVGGKDKVEQREIGEDTLSLSKQTIQEIADHPSRRTITILCVTRPNRILDTPEIQAEFGFEPTAEPGVYRSSKLLIPTWIVHPDELEIIPKNYPLLPLSRGKKLQQFVDLCFDEGWQPYLHFIVDIALTIDPTELLEKIMEVYQMKVKIRPETVLQFDQLLKDMPELIWQASTLREAVEQGTLIGEKRGEELGQERSKREIARTMLIKGMDVTLIAEVTGLEEESIRTLLL